VSVFQSNCYQLPKAENAATQQRRTTSEKESYEVVLVNIDDIKIFRWVRPLDKKHVKRLAASIRDDGIKQPIHLFKLDYPEHGYGIASGHHRFEAMKLLKKTSIPAFILTRDQAEVALWSLILLQPGLGILERSEAIVGYIKARSKLPTVNRLLPKGGKQPHDKGFSKTSAELGYSRKLIASAHKHDALSSDIKETIKNAPHLNKRSILNRLCAMSSDADRREYLDANPSKEPKRKKAKAQDDRVRELTPNAKRRKRKFNARMEKLREKLNSSAFKGYFFGSDYKVRKAFVRRFLLKPGRSDS